MGPEPGLDDDQGFEQVAGAWSPEEALPPEYEIVGLTKTRRSAPRGAEEVGFVAAVGATRADPRFVELTLFEFASPADLAQAGEFVGKATANEPQPLAVTSLPFVFLPPGAGPEQDVRASLELARNGPEAQSVFRGEAGRGRLAVGGAASMGPDDVDVLLAVLLERSSGESTDPLPFGMEVVVDSPLPEGVTVEVESARGTALIEVRDDVPEGWFDFLTWGIDGDVERSPFPDLAVRTSLAPPSDFDRAGDPMDNTVVMTWEDGTLVTITHPQLPDPVVRLLHRSFKGVTVDELRAHAVEAPAPEEQPEARAGRAADPPSPERLAELQNYVEVARGVDFGGPLDYRFVDDNAELRAGASFVGLDLWSVFQATGVDRAGPDPGRSQPRSSRPAARRTGHGDPTRHHHRHRGRRRTRDDPFCRRPAPTTAGADSSRNSSLPLRPSSKATRTASPTPSCSRFLPTSSRTHRTSPASSPIRGCPAVPSRPSGTGVPLRRRPVVHRSRSRRRRRGRSGRGPGRPTGVERTDPVPRCLASG